MRLILHKQNLNNIYLFPLFYDGEEADDISFNIIFWHLKGSEKKKELLLIIDNILKGVSAIENESVYFF